MKVPYNAEGRKPNQSAPPSPLPNTLPLEGFLTADYNADIFSTSSESERSEENEGDDICPGR